MHLDPEHQMFIDLNTNKEFGFRLMIYYLKEYLAIGEFSSKEINETFFIFKSTTQSSRNIILVYKARISEYSLGTS